MRPIIISKDNLRALYDLSLAFDTEMDHEDYGEHVAIGQLVCLKKDLNDERVYWMRPYHRMGVINPNDWINIWQFLGVREE